MIINLQNIYMCEKLKCILQGTKLLSWKIFFLREKEAFKDTQDFPLSNPKIGFCRFVHVINF